MARRSRRRDSLQRDPIVIATRQRAASRPFRLSRRVDLRRPVFLEVEDRRLRDPRGRSRPLQDRAGRPRSRLVSLPYRGSMPRFYSSHNLMVCVRRKMRRQVLHALRRTRAGRGVRRRRNVWSGVSCK